MLINKTMNIIVLPQTNLFNPHKLYHANQSFYPYTCIVGYKAIYNII